MNKKVLITVSGGIASAYAEQGVDVVIVDYDNVYEEADYVNEHPIHNQFLPLMNLAQLSTACPVSDDGRKNEAYYLEPSEADLEVTLRFKPMDLELPPLGAPVFCLLKPGPVKKLIGDKPIVLFLTTHDYFCGSGLSFIVKPEAIEQWALVPASLGGCHAA